MIILWIAIGCGILSGLSALVLQFKLPGWLLLSGLSAWPAEYRSRMEEDRIRRRISFLLYMLSSGFFFGALFVYTQVLAEWWLLPCMSILSLIVCNMCALVYRRHDHNENKIPPARTVFFLLAACNLLFILFVLAFLP